MRQQGFEPTLVSVDEASATNKIIAREQLAWSRTAGSPLPIGYHAPGLQDLLDRLAAEQSADIIHVHSVWSYPTLVAHRAARKSGARLVISPRSEMYRDSLKKRAWLKRLFRLAFVDRVLADAALLHATEDNEAAAIRAFGYRGALATSPNGVDLSIGQGLESRESARRALGIDPDAAVLLFLSRLHPRKNPDVLIDAWVKGGFARSGSVLVMAGTAEDESYRSALEARIPAEWRGQVRWLGHVEGDDKRRAFAAADLFCLPSKFENFGIAIAEALACGVPVVTTDATPWAELEARDAGRIVPVGDVAALSAALVDVMGRSPQDRAGMGQRGREVVSSFTWEASAATMATAYRAILPHG